MIRLEDMKAGALIQGIEPGEVVCAITSINLDLASVMKNTLKQEGL